MQPGSKKTKTHITAVQRQKSRQPYPAGIHSVRSVRSGKAEKLDTFIKPMLASSHDDAFDDKDWIFEIKWDGYRAIAETGKTTRLYSRNGLSFLHLYPSLANALKKVKQRAIVDGEIVVLDKDNKPNFQKLQQFGYHPSLRLVYYVFDCLSINGESTLHLPLLERKKLAKAFTNNSDIDDIVVYADHVPETGIDFYQKIAAMDLEGIIAKRASGLYHPGKRTRDWLKIKNHNTQEAIIAGYTVPRGSREYFGALILAIKEKDKLKYIGHTGTGFTNSLLRDLYEKLKPIHRTTSPFDRKIPVNAKVTWVEPVLVCNIKFTETTEEGILRHPVFMGLRIDKSPDETTFIDVPRQRRKPGTP